MRNMDKKEDYGYQTACPDRYNILKEFAKKNRTFPTLTETILWHLLKGRAFGVKFQRQHIVCDYIADFICIEKKIIIEVDGGYHFRGNQIVKDILRDDRLEKLGYIIVRFKNEEILHDTERVINIIKGTILAERNEQ